MKMLSTLIVYVSKNDFHKYFKIQNFKGTSAGRVTYIQNNNNNNNIFFCIVSIKTLERIFKKCLLSSQNFSERSIFF